MIRVFHCHCILIIHDLLNILHNFEKIAFFLCNQLYLCFKCTLALCFACFYHPWYHFHHKDPVNDYIIWKSLLLTSRSWHQHAYVYCQSCLLQVCYAFSKKWISGDRLFFNFFNIKVFLEITNLVFNGKLFYSFIQSSACETRSLGLD